MSEPNGARTHEPSLRELTAEADGTKALILSKFDSLRELVDERDRLYKERDDARRTAVDAALAAVKEQTKASFDASEKAIVKAEEAQKAYNTAHNDLSRKMDEQNKATMPRLESQQRFDNLTKEVAELKGAVTISGGVVLGSKAVKDESRANLALIISFIVLLLAVASRFIK